MNTRRRLACLALATVAPVALSACGGSDNSEATRVKAALKASILKSERTGADANSPLKLNDSQAGCFAGDLVDHIGVSQLKKDGVVSKDDKVTKALSTSGLKLPVAEAGTFVSALFDCTNGGGQVVTLFRNELNSQMTTLPVAARNCINAKIDAAMIRKILVATLSGQGQDQIRAQVTQITEGCVNGAS